MDIGFIGYGNMASAIVNGIINNNIINSSDIYIYDINPKKTENFLNINICHSIDEVCNNANIIFLCVKPNDLINIVSHIKVENKAYVSIAAGITQEKLQHCLPDNSRIVRVMPNMPLLVGCGAVCIQTPNNLKKEESKFVEKIFSTLGIVQNVKGSLMNTVTGISGSGPAYVYLFINILANAGINNGLSEKSAYELALATFEGATTMLRKTKASPKDLITAVCSPGGTTLAAMQVFENEDIASIIENAVNACILRSIELSE